MENVTEALQMAAAVLVFVLALGIGISSFSQARETADILIRYKDRETLTQYTEYEGNTNAIFGQNRIVSGETIIPTLYRAYNENYRIVFEGLSDPLYRRNDENRNPIDINYIDLQAENVGTPTRARNFIMALLYGKKVDQNTEDINRLKDANGNSYSYNEFVNSLKQNYNGYFEFLRDDGIYDTIVEGTFVEQYGVFYLEDLENNSNSGGQNLDDDFEDAETPEADKIKKRVITYTLQ